MLFRSDASASIEAHAVTRCQMCSQFFATTTMHTAAVLGGGDRAIQHGDVSSDERRRARVRPRARGARATSSACARPCWASSTAARTSGADLGRRHERRPRVGFGRKRLRLNGQCIRRAELSFFSPRRSTFLYNKRGVGVEKTFCRHHHAAAGEDVARGADATRTGGGNGTWELELGVDEHEREASSLDAADRRGFND